MAKFLEPSSPLTWSGPSSNETQSHTKSLSCEQGMAFAEFLVSTNNFVNFFVICLNPTTKV